LSVDHISAQGVLASRGDDNNAAGAITDYNYTPLIPYLRSRKYKKTCFAPADGAFSIQPLRENIPVGDVQAFTQLPGEYYATTAVSHIFKVVELLLLRRC